jgi:hypothetical protein
MDSSWQVRCLQDRIQSLNSEIARVRQKDHPYPEPNAIFRTLLAVLSDRQSRFDKAVKRYSSAGRERLLEETALTTATQLDEIAEAFGLADRVDSARIPFEILRAVSWVASSILEEACRVAVRLDGAYNYSIVSCRRRFTRLRWNKFWDEATRELGPEGRFTILVLGFPSAHANSILLHALAAHELGHLVRGRFTEELEEIRTKAVEAAKHRHSELLQEYILDNVRRREGVLGRDAYDESSRRMEARLGQLADDWLGEVFADLVAATLVGPAFLAAFDEIVLELGKPSLTHPPGTLRRGLVKEYLQQRLQKVADDAVWSGVLQREVASDPLFGPREVDGDPDRPLYSVGQTICREGLRELSAVAMRIPSPLETADLKKIVDQMEDHIEHLSPPSAGLDDSAPITPDEFWRLMYAGWHFRLNDERFAEFKTNNAWDDGNAEHVIGNLVMHALESMELRHQWQKYRENKE